MDIRLYISVLLRHHRVLVAGLIATAVLVFFAAFTISGGKLNYRTAATWKSTTSLLVTQPGFPISSASTSPNFDPTRLSYLASLYVQLAQSDEVRRAVVGSHGSVTNGKLSIDDGRITGSYTATQVLSVDGQRVAADRHDRRDLRHARERE